MDIEELAVLRASLATAQHAMALAAEAVAEVAMRLQVAEQQQIPAAEAAESGFGEFLSAGGAL